MQCYLGLTILYLIWYILAVILSISSKTISSVIFLNVLNFPLTSNVMCMHGYSNSYLTNGNLSCEVTNRFSILNQKVLSSACHFTNRYHEYTHVKYTSSSQYSPDTPFISCPVNIKMRKYQIFSHDNIVTSPWYSHLH